MQVLFILEKQSKKGQLTHLGVLGLIPSKIMIYCALTFSNADPVAQQQQTYASNWKLCRICLYAQYRKVQSYCT